MADEGNEGEVVKAKGSNKGVLILVAVNTLFLAGGAYFVWARTAEVEETVAEQSSGEGSDEAAEESGGDGPLLDLEAFVANLDETEESRYVKAAISLELRSNKAKEHADKRLTPIRDAVLMYLSSLSAADIQSPEDKEEMRKEIKGKLNAVLGNGAVKKVYFRELVLQ